MNYPCEFIEVIPYNPLISKCVIKVLYVSDEPNRNGTIITKNTAMKIAQSLPGSPIAGYYNEQTEDFEEHNRVLEIKNGEFKITKTTRPYGFVDLGAKVWFQKYLDDDSIEREYLLTEGWLWTGQYPEVARIIEKGNNQSMELDSKFVQGTWTKDYNNKQSFFIINEAIISELCILGEDYEPCFEGASITQFSLSFEEEFKTQLFSMMNEFKQIIEEGGTIPLDTTNEVQEVISEDGIVTEVEAEVEITEYAEKKNEEKEGKSEQDNANNSQDSTEEEKCSECGKPVDECECKKEEDKKKETYSLEEIPEYVELATAYSALVAENEGLKANIDSLNEQISSLTEFKKTVERKDKEEMISSFTMLSDEDKLDVVTNIDTYSLSDIEAKLSIICVRKRVSFSAEEDAPKTAESVTTYSLNAEPQVDDMVPDWVKAVRATVKNMNI